MPVARPPLPGIESIFSKAAMARSGEPGHASKRSLAALISCPQLSSVGYAYAVAGRRTEALSILKELEERHATGEIVGQSVAAVYVGLGDLDQAFAWLEKDFQHRNAELQYVVNRTQFEQLRSDPRYTDLIRRMGLKP